MNSLPDLPVWQLPIHHVPPHPAVACILAVVVTSLLVFLVSPEVKQPGCEADRSPLSCADIKNRWSYTSTSSYVFMASTEATLFLLLTHICSNVYLCHISCHENQYVPYVPV
jgi:hypothetical protein